MILATANVFSYSEQPVIAGMWVTWFVSTCLINRTMPIEFNFSIVIYLIAAFALSFKGGKLPYYAVLFAVSVLLNIWPTSFLAGLIMCDLPNAKVFSRAMKNVYGRVTLYSICLGLMILQLFFSKQSEKAIDDFFQ